LKEKISHQNSIRKQAEHGPLLMSEVAQEQVNIFYSGVKQVNSLTIYLFKTARFGLNHEQL
jgi:hypothetical protein